MSTPEILKEAVKEIEKILVKHDLAGIVTLASGNGHAKYLNHVVDQTWSALTIENTPNGVGIRIRAKAKTAPAKERLMERIKLNKTINACINFRDVFALQFGMIDNLVNLIKEKIPIEEGKSTHIPRKD